MKKIITFIIFVLVFGKTQAQRQWNIVSTMNDTIAGHFSHLLNVIDSTNVILIPKYTYDTPNILRTTNAGQSWTSHIIDTTMYTFLHEAQFVNSNTGYIVGGTDFGNWNVLLKTTDGGQNWQNMNAESSFTSIFPARITELSFVDDLIGFIARGEENKIYRTIDGGNSFTSLDLPQIPNGFYSYLTEIQFINPYVGFISRMQTNDYINSSVEILKTTDGGNSWVITNTTNLQNVSVWEKKDKIQFVNNLQGFAIVGTGILKTTQNGGNSWTEYNLPLITPPPTDFCFVNNACGYIALAGNIYRTNDTGQSWSLQNIENNLDDIKYIQFATENFGYALNAIEITSPNQIITTLLNTNQQSAPPLSSKIFEDNSFSIYPNPANDVIYIKNTNNSIIDFIHLIDLSGKIIKTYKNNTSNLDISNVSSGTYLLFIQTSHQKTVKKIIIR